MQRIRILRWTLALALLAAIAAAFVFRGQLELEALQAMVGDLGAWAILAFIAFYAIAPILFLPGTVFTLLAGALFGPFWGTLYALTGATIGATLAFLIARYLASDWVRRKARGRLRQLIDGVSAEGWRFVAFTRLVPLFPYNLLNYALGLTGIRLDHYVVTSFVCMAPATFAYAYIGFVGRQALTGQQQDLIRNLLIALALIAFVLFIPRLVKRLRGTTSDIT